MKYIKSQRVFMNGKEIDAEINIGKKFSLEDALESIEKVERIMREINALKSSLADAEEDIRERVRSAYEYGSQTDIEKLTDGLNYIFFKRQAQAEEAEKSRILYGE